MEKELKVYQVILFCCGLLLGILMAYASSLNNKIDKLEDSYDSSTCEIGNDVENWILDVVYETDLFEDITEDEKKYLDELWDEENYSRYYIELVILYGKYYKE